MPMPRPNLTLPPASPSLPSSTGRGKKTHRVERGWMSAIAMLVIALPTPATAQAWSTISSTPAGPSVERQVNRIRQDIRNGRETGQLSRREAKNLRRTAGNIDLRAGMYAQNGLTDSERSFLDSNAAALRSQVVVQRSQTKR